MRPAVPPSSSPVRWFRRLAMAFGGVACAVALVAGAIDVTVQYDGNVHAVESGQVYRSAQLSPARLGEIARDHGIHSIVNLRGDNTGQAWYDDEVRAARAAGIAHVDVPLSAEHDVTLAKMDAVLRIVAAAPKPVLIHCKAGADRTGLVSAIYELQRGMPVADASRQLSLRYGHFPYLWSRTDAMDRSLAVFIAARTPTTKH